MLADSQRICKSAFSHIHLLAWAAKYVFISHIYRAVNLSRSSLTSFNGNVMNVKVLLSICVYGGGLHWLTNNLTEALQIIIHYHQPAQKYMHFPRQLNLDKLHRDSLTNMDWLLQRQILSCSCSRALMSIVIIPSVKPCIIKCMHISMAKSTPPRTNYMGSIYSCLSVLLHTNRTGTPHLYTPWYLSDYFLSTIRSCSNTCSVCRPHQFIPLRFHTTSRTCVFINFGFLKPMFTLIYDKKHAT